MKTSGRTDGTSSTRPTSSGVVAINLRRQTPQPEARSL
jgi:hypothetical protein